MKKEKVTKEKKQINWAKGFAITGWAIIALAVSFGVGFYSGHSSATPVQTQSK